MPSRGAATWRQRQGPPAGGRPGVERAVSPGRAAARPTPGGGSSQRRPDRRTSPTFPRCSGGSPPQSAAPRESPPGAPQGWSPEGGTAARWPFAELDRGVGRQHIVGAPIGDQLHQHAGLRLILRLANWTVPLLVLLQGIHEAAKPMRRHSQGGADRLTDHAPADKVAAEGDLLTARAHPVPFISVVGRLVHASLHFSREIRGPSQADTGRNVQSRAKRRAGPEVVIARDAAAIEVVVGGQHCGAMDEGLAFARRRFQEVLDRPKHTEQTAPIGLCRRARVTRRLV